MSSSTTTGARQVLHVRVVTAAFVHVRETRCPTPDHREPRRPRSPERQDPPRRRPEYDYFHDNDYFDYFNRHDYFDYDNYFDYVAFFLFEPEVPRTRCVTPTLSL